MVAPGGGRIAPQVDSRRPPKASGVTPLAFGLQEAPQRSPRGGPRGSWTLDPGAPGGPKRVPRGAQECTSGVYNSRLLLYSPPGPLGPLLGSLFFEVVERRWLLGGGSESTWSRHVALMEPL